jgi:nitrogenase molybdenum-iron protein alpha/beta subunit
LQIGYNVEAEKILNDMGYSCDFASKGKATTAYLDELKRIKKHIQANNIMYQESMQKAAKFLEGKAGKKLTESEFMGYVAAVSKFTGFNISINSVRVAEFAALANYMTISTKKQSNGGRKN